MPGSPRAGAGTGNAAVRRGQATPPYSGKATRGACHAANGRRRERAAPAHATEGTAGVAPIGYAARVDGARSDRVTGGTWGAAARGAVAGGAGAFLAVAAASRRVPGPIVEIVGPPPLPAVLAAVCLLVAPIAGAVVARGASRAKGPPWRRVKRILASTFVAYLATVTTAAAVTSALRFGFSTLVMPFGVLGYCLVVALLLLPWSAPSVVGTALVVEGWTRPVPRGRRPWSFPLAVMLVAGAVLLVA